EAAEDLVDLHTIALTSSTDSISDSGHRESSRAAVGQPQQIMDIAPEPFSVRFKQKIPNHGDTEDYDNLSKQGHKEISVDLPSAGECILQYVQNRLVDEI